MDIPKVPSASEFVNKYALYLIGGLLVILAASWGYHWWSQHELRSALTLANQSVGEKETRIASLETQVTGLQASIDRQNTALNELDSASKERSDAADKALKEVNAKADTYASAYGELLKRPPPKPVLVRTPTTEPQEVSEWRAMDKLMGDYWKERHNEAAGAKP